MRAKIEQLESSFQVCFSSYKARIYLLVDLRDFFFSDLGSGGRKKKSFENDQLTGHFQSFFFFFQFFFSFLFFLNVSITNSKTSKVNQQSVLNLKIFQHFHKNLDRIIIFNNATQKYTDRTSKIYYFFQRNK